MKEQFKVAKKPFMWLLLPALLMALSGCGSSSTPSSSSSSSSASSSPLAISGQVIDGPVSGAQVIVYQATSSGLSQVGTGYTQADGSFALTINNYVSSDYYLLYVSGGTFSNNGLNDTAPTMVGFLVPGGTATVYITPLTTLIGEALFNANGTINTSLNSTQVDFYLQQMFYYVGQLFKGMSGSNLNGISSSNPAQSQLINELLTLLQDLANDVAGQTGEQYSQAMQDLLSYLSYSSDGASQALQAALTSNGGNGNFVFSGFQFTGNGGGTVNISGALSNGDQTELANATTPPPLPAGLSNIGPNFTIPATVTAWIASADGTVRKVDSSGNVSGPYQAGPSPNSMAVDNNGNVWITGAGVVTELNSAGTSEQTCYLHTGGNSSNGPDFYDDNYVAVDYSNNVWVTSALGYNFTPESVTSQVRFGGSNGSGEFSYYENITKTYQDWHGAIIKLNSASCGLNQSANPYITFFDLYNGSGNLSNPGPIAVDHSDNLWVVGLQGGFPVVAGQFQTVSIAEVNSSTGSLNALPSGVPVPGLQNFDSIATDPAGNLWAYAPYDVLSAGTPNLSEIKPAGSVVNYPVGYETGLAANNGWFAPYLGPSMAVDPSGNIWVAATPYGATSSSVYEYSSSNGSLINEYDLSVTVPGFQVSPVPEQIAFDSSGNVWVIGKGASGADGVIVINPKTAGGQQAFFQVPDPVAITSGSYSLSAPSISAASPAKNATGISTSSTVTATFSAAMNASTINSGTFTLTGPTGTSVSGTVTYDTSTNTATFAPSFPLSTGTQYTATVNTGAYGLDGVALASNYSWSFTTASPPPGGVNTITVGGGPTGIAIDASGNVWVANTGSNTVQELNASSGSISGTFSVTGAAYLAIDASGNVWVTGGGTTITELLKGSGYTPATFNTAVPMYQKAYIAIDPAGNVWTATTEFLAPSYTTTTTLKTSSVCSGTLTGVAVDSASNVWIGCNMFGYGEVIELLRASTYSSSNVFSMSSVTGPEGLAIDASGNAWVANNPGSGIAGTVVTLTAPATSSSPYATGIAPEGVAIDHSGNVWVANSGSNTVTEMNASGVTLQTYSVGTFPTDLAIDASGNVWVTNAGAGTVSELVGVATGPQFFPYSGPQFP